jgi:hypothetical protein
MTGADLRAWMARHRYSIRALSEVLEIHPSTLQRYRQGQLPVPALVELALKTVEREGAI